MTEVTKLITTPRRRTRTYDRQYPNLEKVIDDLEGAINDHTHVADDISDASDVGKDILRAGGEAAVRNRIDVESTAQLDARDTANRDRGNHTGTQPASTISDFRDAALAAVSYTHQQMTPAAVWTIAHALGYRPGVHVTDSAGDECYGEINHPSLDTTTITFSAAFSGVARLT